MSVTSGELQPGITVVVNLTVAVQGEWSIHYILIVRHILLKLQFDDVDFTNVVPAD